MSNHKLLMALGTVALEFYEGDEQLTFDTDEAATSVLLQVTTMFMSHCARGAASALLDDVDNVLRDASKRAEFCAKYTKCVSDANLTLESATIDPPTSPHVGILAFTASKIAGLATDGNFLCEKEHSHIRHEGVKAVLEAVKRVHVSAVKKVDRPRPSNDSVTEPPLKKAAPSTDK
jgi:hypothetical protein